ncbi:hypothetical protein ACFL27_21080 [candidate division CSSED10-310 bacterium]|uniref:RadC-like JAB domain-containing protein n=1 Tax=candidate division CSSED10-310 bacterium TaxID=2855610 RepID=A0ABV6Z2N7_UNCC1
MDQYANSVLLKTKIRAPQKASRELEVEVLSDVELSIIMAFIFGKCRELQLPSQCRSILVLDSKMKILEKEQMSTGPDSESQRFQRNGASFKNQKITLTIVTVIATKSGRKKQCGLYLSSAARANWG